jgi:hypothetical protein
MRPKQNAKQTRQSDNGRQRQSDNGRQRQSDNGKQISGQSRNAKREQRLRLKQSAKPTKPNNNG